jgi:hypothetical protein
MLWRLIRSMFLLFVGAVAGFAAAAGVLRGALTSRGDEGSDELALVAIFNGIDLANRSTAFRGGSLLAWFGGIALDLRDATLAPGARVEARSLFGGVAIRVPTTWRVESASYAFAGGVDASTAAPDDPDAPTLVVDAVSVFGGISITN